MDGGEREGQRKGGKERVSRHGRVADRMKGRTVTSEGRDGRRREGKGDEREGWKERVTSREEG